MTHFNFVNQLKITYTSHIMEKLDLLDDTRLFLDKVNKFDFGRSYSYLSFNKNWSLSNRYNKFENPTVDKFLKKLKIEVTFQKIECAQYIHDDDKIIMPYKRHFRKLQELTKEQNYYCTLFHEIMHWTGSKNRMNRKSLSHVDDVDNFGNVDKLHYLEELTAEIGCVFLMRYFDICEHFPEPSLIYIKKYLGYIPEELQKYYFVRAHKGARLAVEFLIAKFEKTRKKKV